MILWLIIRSVLGPFYDETASHINSQPQITLKMSDKPVLLFVHGAWHPPKCYDAIKLALTNLNYQCIIPKLPSVGPESHGVTWEADKTKIIETAEPFFNQGREVVLIAHSYGGIPATAATEGQGTEERAKRGLKGGFHSIIFLAAFAIPVKGWDLITTFGGAYPPWLQAGEKYAKVSNIKAFTP
jgi:pimeloyl-ACP methyl ester carboxylesterase